MITYDGKDKMRMNAETKDFPSEKSNDTLCAKTLCREKRQD